MSQQRAKKPPINLSELARDSQGEGAPGPGRLEYQEKPERKKEKNGKNDDGGGMKGTIGIILGIFAVFLVAVIFVTKPWDAAIKQLDKNDSDLNARITGLQATLTSVSGKLDNVIAAQGTYAKQDAFNGLQAAVGQSTQTVATLNAQIQGLPQKITDLGTSIGNVAGSVETLSKNVVVLGNLMDDLKKQQAADEATITALTTRVQLLETSGGSSSSSSGGSNKFIKVALKSLGNNALSPIDTLGVIGGTNTWDGLSGSLRVTLTNTSNFDVDDVTLDIQITMYPSLPAYTTVSLSGGGVPWTSMYRDQQNAEFYNGAWGLKVPAGQSLNLNLVLTFQGATDNAAWNLSGGYYYQAQVSVS